MAGRGGDDQIARDRDRPAKPIVTSFISSGQFGCLCFVLPNPRRRLGKHKRSPLEHLLVRLRAIRANDDRVTRDRYGKPPYPTHGCLVLAGQFGRLSHVLPAAGRLGEHIRSPLNSLGRRVDCASHDRVAINRDGRAEQIARTARGSGPSQSVSVIARYAISTAGLI